ncbi:hypothetical protein ASPFODRAFT_714066 [Aspergillus luchuensis CBS 106.47]|uniref:Stc1 domain-containing protein n=1 Tax=Aspergillus luchuensis (strain CBS 106.47) TaxID=1137211 RepID=A0A1M3SYR3_ASPLC|nr:hypothetical protein ASPFODRAFT_714066 [Aspergillus luchuensis CBS 106.47]
MSSSTLQSNYKGASIDGDGDFLCKCGFKMYKSTIWHADEGGKAQTDIRQYGILTPVTSSRKVHPAIDRASSGNEPSQITFSAQAKKRSLFSTSGQVPKKPRIVCTPSRSPSPTPSKSPSNGSPAYGLNDTFPSSRPETMHFMRGGSRRWEDYEKDLSMTPTKNKSHVRDFNPKGWKTEAEKGKDEEDLLS